MSQRDREERWRVDLRALEQLAATRPLHSVDERRRRELVAKLAKIDARRGGKKAAE